MCVFINFFLHSSYLIYSWKFKKQISKMSIAFLFYAIQNWNWNSAIHILAHCKYVVQATSDRWNISIKAGEAVLLLLQVR